MLATVIVVLVITLIAKFSFKPQFKHKNLIFSLSGGAVALAFIITMSCIDFTNSSMDVTTSITPIIRMARYTVSILT